MATGHVAPTHHRHRSGGWELIMRIRRCRVAVGAGLALALGVAGFSPAAHAEDDSPPSAVAGLAAADGLASPVAAGAESDSGGVVAQLGDGSIEVSTSPDQALALEGPTGSDVQVGLPGGSAPGVVDGGSVVYPDVATDAAVVARPTADGAQALIVISDSSAPTEFAFPVRIEGARSELRPGPDHTVEVWEEGAQFPSATIAQPWATDADGNPVPTHFDIRGTSVVQVVDHRGAAYPVVADPKFTWGWLTGTAYLNRLETRSLKTFSAAAGLAAMICAGAGLATAGWGCVGSGAYAAQWLYVAGNAYSDHKCVKIKLPYMVAFPYSGGHCR